MGGDSVTTLPAGKDPATGRFTTGNRWWEARSSHGRKPIFDNANDLLSACLEYFEWNEANPLHEAKLTSFQGQNTIEPVPKMRAMTLHGLCMFLDITRETWNEWRKSRPDFSDVITQVEDAIFRQKFEGASADLLNPNIIARDLGLADKKDLSSSDGTMTPRAVTVNMTPQEAAEAYAASLDPDQS
jgi:hypothetical protein